MRSKGTRTIKPVDEDHQIHDHPARANLEALMDQKLFHQRIKSERASAYWFAASLWGVTGLILGAFLGVYITLAVQQGSADVWRDNFIAGAAADAAQDSVNRRPSLLPGPDEQQPPQNP
ncbi:MAG: hypothetical protein DCF16_03180 [Alphaproteobacteria bacterium]|nr:MAG: hypothetical protein DCF16_03180 [Alphaproteobacteria bacterium]